MLVRFGYQTHLEIRPQPNYRLEEFLLTNPRILMLLSEQNSFFFFVSREANRKCEPKFNLCCGISVVVSVVMSSAIFADTCGEIQGAVAAKPELPFGD